MVNPRIRKVCSGLVVSLLFFVIISVGSFGQMCPGPPAPPPPPPEGEEEDETVPQITYSVEYICPTDQLVIGGAPEIVEAYIYLPTDVEDVAPTGVQWALAKSAGGDAILNSVFSGSFTLARTAWETRDGPSGPGYWISVEVGGTHVGQVSVRLYHNDITIEPVESSGDRCTFWVVESATEPPDDGDEEPPDEDEIDLEPPVTSTTGFDNLTGHSVELSGRLENPGAAGDVDVFFELGESEDLSDRSEETAGTITPTDNGDFSLIITGLDVCTTYYFRARAEGAGIDYGETISFTTLLELPRPIVEYRFEQASGTRITNTGSYGPSGPGTLTGWESDIGISTATPPEVVSDHSLYLSGCESYVRIPDEFNYQGDSFTVEAWVRPSELGHSGPESYIWDDYGFPGVLLSITSSGHVRFTVSTADNPDRGISLTAGDIVPGQWHHIAGVYDGIRMAIYVNGQDTCIYAVNSGAIQDNSSVNPTRAGMAIGADAAAAGMTCNLAGLIDELRIYPVALQRCQLARGFFADIPAEPCAGP